MTRSAAVQSILTQPINLCNRAELGIIQSITDDGRMALKMDSGKSISIDPREHPHLDHGYAVTSHSSQGQTADRVLINIDTELGAKDLINNRMAYVAVSRGAQDAQIFTSDREKLPAALSRDVSHQSAYLPEIKQEVAIAPEQRLGRDLACKEPEEEPKQQKIRRENIIDSTS